MRIVLAEDHPLMQKALSALLLQKHEIVAVVTRGDEVVEVVALHSPEVVVLDVSLPGRSGLQVLPQLRQQHPKMVLLVVTTHSDPVYRSEAHRRGADGYILKRCATQDLLPALQKAIARRAGSTPKVTQYG